MRNTEEYRGSRYEEDEDEEYEDEENEKYKEEEDEDEENAVQYFRSLAENEKYKEEEDEDEDEEYKEEGEAENPHLLAFRQEAKILDDWIYDRFDDNLDLGEGRWLPRDTRALCGMLREAIDNTMGKEQSEARTEVAEAVTKMIFQPITEGTATRKYIHSVDADKIGDSEKQELIEYIAEDQKAFQTFLADGKMDERDSIIGMHEAIDCSINVAWTDSNMEIARDQHNPDMKECRELEYKEEEPLEQREGESPDMLTFRQEAKLYDDRMYERFDDNLDMADGTWDNDYTNSLCAMLKEVLDYTMGKEQSEARTEIAEALTKMIFQPLLESTAKEKHPNWLHEDEIGDAEKQELLGYIAKEQMTFQTFLADGEMDEWDSIKGMHETVGDSMAWTNHGDLELAREVHNVDMQE